MRFLLFLLITCSSLFSTELLLYYTPYCPYSKKVLHYLKTIHKTVPMENVSGNPEGKAALIRLGGKAVVPCLIIDGKALYESEDIIKWLAEHQQELGHDQP